MISKKFELNDEIVAIGATKMEIAKIQIESAIEMLFQGHHPITVHTVAQSGFQIVRDLAKAKELPALMNLEKADTEFWKKASSALTAFNHALNDSADQFPGIKQELNDISIFFAIHLFSSLGGKPTPAMNTFFAMMVSRFPQLTNADLPQLTPEVTQTAKQLSREQLLLFGSLTIGRVRTDAEKKTPELMQ